MSELDPEFFDRADEHINLSNSQLKEDLPGGAVSASMMFATARFNAWLTAVGWESAEQMKEARQETIDYFVREYTIMLEDNLDEYIEKYDEYLQNK